VKRAVVLFLAGCSSGMPVMSTSDSGVISSDGAAMDTSIDSPAIDSGGGDASNDTADGTAPMMGLHAMGNAIFDGNKQIKIAGVNRSGSEYSCIQNVGFFDGPADMASIAAIQSWKANAVRVPLNEDCWLAINNSPQKYSGAAYQKAIDDYVQLLLAAGIYPILELHWTAPGTQQATGQKPMPDADHSPAMWSQVAAAYKNSPSVIFELFNEPYPDNNQDTQNAWTCWRDGGNCGLGYTVAGMQSLLDSVRNAGAKNLVLLGGVRYSNTLTQWLNYKPNDSANNVAAAWHIYNFNACNNQQCWQNNAGIVAQKFPVVATEIGEDDCQGGFITSLMGYLDGLKQNYLAWTWDTWGGCLVLVNNYNGTPAGTYGQSYKTHLLSL